MGITTHIDGGMASLSFVPRLQSQEENMTVEDDTQRFRPLKALALVPAIPVAAAMPTAAVHAASAGPVPGAAGALAFYAAAATLVGVFVLLNAALKNRIGLYYAALFAIMLAVVWVLDRAGGALPLGLIDSHERLAALTLALMGCALGFCTAGRAIAPDHRRSVLRRAFHALTAVSLGAALAVWFVPAALAVPAVNALLAVMLLGHVVPAVTWRSMAGRPFRLPALTAGSLFLIVAILFPVYGLSQPGGAAFDPAWLRWLFALVALPAMAAIALAVLDLGRAREAALEDAVAAARKEAKTASALLTMERNYAQARDIAARQTRRVSTVAHDIRQPIAALRAELDALRTDIDDIHTDRFTRILDHFDSLTGDLSGDLPGNPIPESDGVEAATSGQADAEDVPAALLFSMLHRLFDAEATASGMTLRFVPSSAIFHAPPVAITRIASNLIANAIAHSGATGILVGVRRDGDRWRLMVLDNGRGFDGIGLDAARAAGAKGADSGGSGLGLSIVDELAATGGLGVDARAAAGRGAAFSISVPGAKTG